MEGLVYVNTAVCLKGHVQVKHSGGGIPRSPEWSMGPKQEFLDKSCMKMKLS